MSCLLQKSNQSIKTMVDFVKLNLSGIDIDKLLNNDLLVPVGKFNYVTGEEISSKIEAEYKGIKFIIYRGGRYIELQGSLHKYSNNGKHNYDKFDFDRLRAVLHDLDKKFDLNIFNQKIVNIEFGVNIQPPTASDKILNCLLTHHGSDFKDVSLVHGNCKEAIHQRHYVKAYNKQSHAASILRHKHNDLEVLKNEIFRFELKFVKMIDLNEVGIYVVGDMLKGCAFLIIYNLLVTHWTKILMYDPTICNNELNPYTRKTKINQWQNKNYWKEITKQERQRQLKRYNKVVLLNSKQIHNQMSKLIENECYRLKNGVTINHHL